MLHVSYTELLRQSKPEERKCEEESGKEWRMYLHYRPVFIETIHIQVDTLRADGCVKESNVGMSDEFAKAPHHYRTVRLAAA